MAASPTDDLASAERRIQELTKELSEAREQQAATAEILRVISSSPTDVQRVFAEIAESAAYLCDAYDATIHQVDGDLLRLVAHHGPIPVAGSWPLTRGRLLTGAVINRRTIHVADLQAETDEYPEGSEIARRLGYHTILVVPLIRAGVAIGVITIRRTEVRPFADRQIQLLKTFADQAVIAIENTRLFEAEQASKRELQESLEYQTATSDVLGVISRTPTDLQPVLAAICDTAARLCETKDVEIFIRHGDRLRLGWVEGPIGTEAEDWPISRGLVMGRAVLNRELIQVRNLRAADDEYPEGYQSSLLVGHRTIIAVPLMRKREAVGVLTLRRSEVKPFTDKQITLLRTFADQAVIAIENARLLNELDTLNKQLEQRVAEQVGEIERMSRLRRFLPPQVADLIVTSGTEKQLESHRREITALFCDLRGFTGFSESSDPEDVMALLRDYHAAIGKIVIKYSGTLERFAGDGVMVIFNDPVPVPNPALQAVSMALDMRVTLGAMIEKWRLLGHDLGFGIGIAHGFATLGTIGFEGRFDYAAIGTVSNVASRLCDEAKPGQILISPRVRQAVEKAVTAEPIGEFTLKGIRRPIAAYNVLASSSSKPN